MIGALAIIAMSLAAEAASGISNDVYWLLHAAGRVLDGAVLYRDVVDTNPPLSVWIYLPIAFVARTTGIAPVLVLRGGITLFALAILFFADRVWRRAGSTHATRLLLAGVGLVATLTLPLAAFGQREHFVFLLSLPYVAAAVLRYQGVELSRWNRIFAGVLLGVAVALKPFYGILWVSVEATLLIRIRRRAPVRVSPESLAVLAVGIVYLLLAVTVGGEFLRVLPVVLDLYPRYAPEPLGALVLRYPFVWFTLGALLIAALSRQVAGGALPTVLGVAVGAQLIAALLQAKGYPYHFYPASASALLLLGSIAGSVPRASRVTRLVVTTALAVPIAYLLAAALRLGLGPLPVERRALANLQAVTGPTAGRSVAALSPKTGLAMWVAAYGGGRWIMRHSCLWVPVTIYDGTVLDAAGEWMHSPDSMPPAERWFFDGTVDDLTRYRPDVLIVQLPQGDPRDVRRGIDWIQYFGQDARFRELLAEYHEIGQAEGYAVYRRTSAGST